MTTGRGSLGSSMLLAFLAVGTAWVAMLAWSGFTEIDADYLLPLIVIGAVIAAVGALTRWWRWPALVVVGAQLVVAASTFCLVITGSLVPTSAARADLVDAFRRAWDSAQAFAAPVPADAPSVGPLLIVGGLLVMLLVDLLACTLHRPPLAGLPLLTVYGVPISVLGGSVPAWVFVASAVAFLVLLFVNGARSLRGWGRPLDDGRPVTSELMGRHLLSARGRASRLTAMAVGGSATALAVVVPLLVPTLDLDVFAIGPGDGDGGEVKIQNPTADLLRDLNRGPNIPLVQVTTDDDDPDYLRVSTLNRWRGEEWTPGNRDIPEANRPDGKMPALTEQGVSEDLERTEYDYEVSVADTFASFWLPTQFPVSSVTAEGDWRYDERTMDFFHWDKDLDTAGMEYSMTAVDLKLDGRALDRAESGTGDVDDEFLDVPGDLPPEIDQLATRVTRRGDTGFEKAVLLQDFFRDRFEYNLDTSPVQGTGYEALLQFLRKGPGGREGYCEQFAASMAAMARTLGIPARVAVGFLEPGVVSDDVYEYSAHDLHAWPELYFEGFGWVMFEPTPGTRAPEVPAYTQVFDRERPGRNQPSTGNGDQPSANPTAPDPRLRNNQDPRTAGEFDASEEPTPWVPLVWILGLIALVVVIAHVPGWVRRRTRARRLDGGPEEAWAELRDTVTDLHLGWPEARSPRETRDRLVELFGTPEDDELGLPHRHGTEANPEAAFALDRIVADLERVRYSPSHRAETLSLRAELECCLEALAAGATTSARRRAYWLPQSVLGGLFGRRPEPVEPVESTPSGDVIEHVG